MKTYAKKPNTKESPCTEKRQWSSRAGSGLLQVLYERGFVDPSLGPQHYRMSVPDEWEDEDGNISKNKEHNVKNTGLTRDDGALRGFHARYLSPQRLVQ